MRLADPSPTTNRSKGEGEKINYYYFKDENPLAPTTKAIRRVGGAGEQAAPGGAGMQRPHLAGEGKGKEKGKGKGREKGIGKREKKGDTPSPTPSSRPTVTICLLTHPPPGGGGGGGEARRPARLPRK